jgi:hypothetical protein
MRIAAIIDQWGNLSWPYQAMVMKTFEIISSRIVIMAASYRAETADSTRPQIPACGCSSASVLHR